MATTTQGTKREPRIALAITLQRTRPGLASLADIATALDALTAVMSDEDDTPRLDVPHAHAGAITALAVAEDVPPPPRAAGHQRRRPRSAAQLAAGRNARATSG
jgi:hypothetical protein